MFMSLFFLLPEISSVHLDVLSANLGLTFRDPTGLHSPAGNCIFIPNPGGKKVMRHFKNLCMAAVCMAAVSFAIPLWAHALSADVTLTMSPSRAVSLLQILGQPSQKRLIPDFAVLRL